MCILSVHDTKQKRLGKVLGVLGFKSPRHLADSNIFHFIIHFRARPLVQTMSPWKAPILWEGMFDPDLYDQKHIQNESSVALTVFAVGRLVTRTLTPALYSWPGSIWN